MSSASCAEKWSLTPSCSRKASMAAIAKAADKAQYSATRFQSCCVKAIASAAYKAIAGDTIAQDTSNADVYIFLLLRDVGTCIRTYHRRMVSTKPRPAFLCDPVPPFGKLNLNIPDGIA